MWYVLQLDGLGEVGVTAFDAATPQVSRLQHIDLGHRPLARYGAVISPVGDGAAIVERSWPLRVWQVGPARAARLLWEASSDSALVEHLASAGPLRSWTAGPALALGEGVGIDLTNVESDAKLFLRVPGPLGRGSTERRLAGVIAGAARLRSLLLIDYAQGHRLQLRRY